MSCDSAQNHDEPCPVELRAENERLRAALKLARLALTADTIGTIHMDDPDWYAQVDKAVAEIDDALGQDAREEDGK